jgi:FKBP-type peptidyl-prolyl cis-trans isomerase
MSTVRLQAIAWSILVLLGCGEGKGQPVKVETEEEKILYTLGQAVAVNGPLKGLFSPEEVVLVEKGFSDGLSTRASLVEMETFGPKLNAFIQQQMAKKTPQGEGGTAPPPSSGSVSMETEEGKTCYALGQAVASQTLSFFKEILKPEEVAVIGKGFTDGMLQTPSLVEMEVYGPKLDGFIQQLVARVAEPQKIKGRAYLEQAAAEAGAVRTTSGLVYQELLAGTGPQPLASDSVQVHYHGTLIDGTVFDSSVQRGEPVTFPLDQVIEGWQEGVQLMKVGGKARLVVPSELAYKDQPMGPIPAGSTLVFEVELLAIK